ncbi:MAG: endonuclease/exonuclease/phosphatase family protein [Patescibacteria group bacterium]
MRNITVKLLQWNIWYLEKIANIEKQIRELDPDVVCLQELTCNHGANLGIYAAEYLKEKLGMYLNYHFAQQWDKNNSEKEIGDAILSKYPFVNSSFKFLQNPKENAVDYSEEGRVYIEVSVNIKGKIYTIGTSHLSYSHRFEETEKRKLETDNLINIIKEKQTNYIFTGDLNATPDSYTVKNISKYLKNAGPDFGEKTWTTKPFDDKRGFTEDKLNWRIDYVFGTKDIKVRSAKIINTSYSDHLPILLEFLL